MATLEQTREKFGPEFLHYDIASMRHLWPAAAGLGAPQVCDPPNCLPCIALEWTRLAGEVLPVGLPMYDTELRVKWRLQRRAGKEWNR